MLRKTSDCLIFLLLSLNFAHAKSIIEFGAKGDGKTNDTEAFIKASEWLNKAKTGKLFFPKGTYLVGKQTFDGTLKGSAYNGTNLLVIHDAQNIQIEGDKAVIRFCDNLKFCAFDPISGEKIKNTRDYACRAEIGECFQITNCKKVSIKGFEIDGNCDKTLLGGNWFETGYEGLSAGFAIRNVTDFVIENCYIHHFPLDGIYLENPTPHGFATKNQKMLLKNVICQYNCRQGFSWVGGVGLEVVNCDFSHTGQAKWASAPAHGIDIEPELGVRVCAEAHFRNCTFINNKGLAVCTQRLNDGANFDFENCTFEAIDYYCVMVSAPKTVFCNCTFFGSIVLYPHAEKENEGVVFIKCNFNEKRDTNPKKVFGNALIIAENVRFTKIMQCSFKTQSLYQAIFYRNDETIKQSELPLLFKNSFTINSPALDEGHFVVLLRNVNTEGNIFESKLPNKKFTIIAKEIKEKTFQPLKINNLKILE